MKANPDQIRRVVVLGTGTDVGKTYVGVELAKALRRRGREVLALKPVESGMAHLANASDAASGDAVSGTGVDRAVVDRAVVDRAVVDRAVVDRAVVDRAGGDAADLRRAASGGATPLYALRDPLSPHLAARREGLSIDFDALLRWVDSKEREFVLRSPEGASPGAVSLIETAGGCFSPLTDTLNNFDWALALQPAVWVLVAPDCLGVLHDIQATLRALSPRYPELLVLSAARAADASTGTNGEEVEAVVYRQLARSGPLPRALPQVVTVPRHGDLSELAGRLDQMLTSDRAMAGASKQ